jgi:hypothetical protein
MVGLDVRAQDLTLGEGGEGGEGGVAEARQRAARRELRRQIALLEGQLSDVLVALFPHGAIDAPGAGPIPGQTRPAGPRVLSLGELERVRDRLAGRVAEARAELTALGERQARARVRLERMLLAPGEHRFARIANADLGEGGCGVWQVCPRLGLIGMLAGWWHVKLSSGCPLST